MTIIFWACGAILALAGYLTVYRIWRGPTLLDRVLAADVLLAIIVSALCLNMVMKQSYESILLLVAISMIGFVGSVTVARFAENSQTQEKPQKLHEPRPVFKKKG